jgi:hypothetical protein
MKSALLRVLNPFLKDKTGGAILPVKTYAFPELREPVLFEAALDIERAAPLFF